MNMKKVKVVALVMALMLIVSSVAFAMTGEVTGGKLRMRKKANKTATVIGWFADGDTVEIEDSGVSGWYAAKGYVYGSSKCTGSTTYKSGYCMKQYIK